MTVTLRRMRASDLHEVLDIERKLFPEDAWSERMFASELEQPATRYYIVADEDGTVAGYAGLSAARGDQGVVTTIAVRADRHGEGIGTAMLADLIATAAARECRDVFLEVRADNHRARLLYLRTGFSEVGVRHAYYQPSGVDAVVMRLPIPRGDEPAEAAL